MNLNIIYILIIFFTAVGCVRQNDKFWFLDKDKNYNRLETHFKEYINFYPKRGSATLLNSTWSLDPRDEFNIITVFKYTDELFYQIQSKFKESSIAEYKTSDECLLVLNRFYTNTNYGYLSESEIDVGLIDLDCYSDLFPIPNFSNLLSYQTDRTSCKLNKDFIIYVLEAQPGEFLELKNLPEGKYMPEQWKHGYSKGIALNVKEKVIIYWVIIW